MQQPHRHSLQDLFDDVSGVSLAVVTSLHDPEDKHQLIVYFSNNVFSFFIPGPTPNETNDLCIINNMNYVGVFILMLMCQFLFYMLMYNQQCWNY